jgi:hypothetical protein
MLLKKVMIHENSWESDEKKTLSLSYWNREMFMNRAKILCYPLDRTYVAFHGLIKDIILELEQHENQDFKREYQFRDCPMTPKICMRYLKKMLNDIKIKCSITCMNWYVSDEINHLQMNHMDMDRMMQTNMSQSKLESLKLHLDDGYCFRFKKNIKEKHRKQKERQKAKGPFVQFVKNECESNHLITCTFIHVNKDRCPKKTVCVVYRKKKVNENSNETSVFVKSSSDSSSDDTKLMLDHMSIQHKKIVNIETLPQMSDFMFVRKVLDSLWKTRTKDLPPRLTRKWMNKIKEKMLKTPLQRREHNEVIKEVVIQKSTEKSNVNKNSYLMFNLKTTNHSDVNLVHTDNLVSHKKNHMPHVVIVTEKKPGLMFVHLVKRETNDDTTHEKCKEYIVNKAMTPMTFKSRKKSEGRSNVFHVLHKKKLGLRNLGQTCWANATLQALMHIEPFLEMLRKVREGTSAHTSIRNFMSLMMHSEKTWSVMMNPTKERINSDDVFDASSLVNPFRNFDRQSHNKDSSEFLFQHLIPHLGKKLKGFSDLFLVRIKKERMCSGIHKWVREIDDHCMQLYFDEKKKPSSLIELINTNFETRTEITIKDFCNDDANCVYIEKRVVSLPRVLIFYIIRERYTNQQKGESMIVHLKTSPMDIPMEIDVKQMNIMSELSNELKKKYHLYSLVDYESRKKHYVNYSRKKIGKTRSNTWLKFDDAMVMPCDMTKMLTKNTTSQLLFYVLE